MGVVGRLLWAWLFGYHVNTGDMAVGSSHASEGMEGIPCSSADLVSCSRDDLILYYSMSGFSTSRIHRFLGSVHGKEVSKRHIRRIRKRLGVSTTSEAPLQAVIAAIRVGKCVCSGDLAVICRFISGRITGSWCSSRVQKHVA